MLEMVFGAYAADKGDGLLTGAEGPFDRQFGHVPTIIRPDQQGAFEEEHLEGEIAATQSGRGE